MSYTVLVTGVGAIIGYGILRSIRCLDEGHKLIGIDIYPDAVGQAWSDVFINSPMTSSPQYKGWLQEIIHTHKVDIVIPGIEQDLHFLSDNREDFEGAGAKLVLNRKDLVDMSRDKWLMYEELKRIDSPSIIPSHISGDFADLSTRLGLPFLLKLRKSYASKGQVKINSEKDFMPLAAEMGTRYMAQPIVGEDEEEYTASIFGDGTGNINARICFRRKLAQDGSTQKAWIYNSESLNKAIELLCLHFKPLGPTNLQFRRDGDRWYLLEINPRISSATSLRTAFGYNEAGMCLKFFLDGQKIEQPPLRGGHAVRYIEDMVFYDSSDI